MKRNGDPTRALSPTGSARAAGNHELARVLRGYRASSRTGGANGAAWRATRKAFLRRPEQGDDMTVLGAFRALGDTRLAAEVSESEWGDCADAAARAYRRVGREEVAERLRAVFAGEVGEGQARKKMRVKEPVKLQEDVSKKDVGGLRRSPAFHLLRLGKPGAQPHCIGLQDIVLPGAQLAIVCNFKFDVPWMWTTAPALQTCENVLIVHGGTTEQTAEWQAFLAAMGAAERVSFVRPWTPSYGSVHSKMFVLFYERGCRVCVHTSNMIQVDWDFKTQGAYVRDFPVLNGEGSNRNRDDDFKRQLQRYFAVALRGSKACRQVQSRLQAYDFSSAGVALVTSVPGAHGGVDAAAYGHLRLRELLSTETIGSPGASTARAVCQFSSLGSTQSAWLDNEFKTTLFTSADGVGIGEVQLVYPTLQQVEDSIEGLQAGASIPVSKKNLHRAHVMSKLHRWEAGGSGRTRAMPHIKTFLRYDTRDPTALDWVFLGSFNLSVAAWGRLQGMGRKGGGKLNILSYEVGVLCTPQRFCEPVFALGEPVSRSLSSSTKYERSAPDSRPRFEMCRAFWGQGRTASDQSSVERDGATAGIVVEVPLPYALPPPRYHDIDVAWTVDHCSMS